MEEKLISRSIKKPPTFVRNGQKKIEKLLFIFLVQRNTLKINRSFYKEKKSPSLVWKKNPNVESIDENSPKLSKKRE